jgi:hypothetical protein
MTAFPLTGHHREEVLGQNFNFLMARGVDRAARILRR